MSPAKLGQIWIKEGATWRIVSLQADIVRLSGPGPARSVRSVALQELHNHYTLFKEPPMMTPEKSMSVQELIDLLERVEDKSLPIGVEFACPGGVDEGWGGFPVEIRVEQLAQRVDVFGRVYQPASVQLRNYDDERP